MRKASVGITREGYPIISLAALATLASAMLDWEAVTVVCFLVCVFSFHFFRDPERVVPVEPDVAVSPADGRVLGIYSRTDPLNGETRECVSIFMNVLNVHVNRTPVAGVVTDIRYHEGAFFNASWDKASTDNERCGYAVRDKDGNTWTFVQIAGLLARRIVCRAEIGDELERGERIGMIRFGSRVDLYLPAGYRATCAVDQRVFAGQSIVAKKIEA